MIKAKRVSRLGAAVRKRAAPDLGNRKVAQIMSAALLLFLDQGFDLVTMDMVAFNADVSKATLYSHFKSKEDLFLAVMTREANLIMSSITIPAYVAGDVTVALTRIARDFMKIFMDEKAFMLRRAVVGAIPHFPSIGHKIYTLAPHVIATQLSEFLATADRANVLRVPNPMSAAHQFLSLLRGDIDIRGLLAMELPSAKAVKSQVEEAVAMFVAYYSRSNRSK